ncbi:hypothetical protein BH20ACT23_BH20ACT23_27540 [soil metagenome]
MLGSLKAHTLGEELLEFRAQSRLIEQLRLLRVEGTRRDSRIVRADDNVPTLDHHCADVPGDLSAVTLGQEIARRFVVKVFGLPLLGQKGPQPFYIHLSAH